MPHGMWDLTSPTRVQTHAPCPGSTERAELFLILTSYPHLSAVASCGSLGPGWTLLTARASPHRPSPYSRLSPDQFTIGRSHSHHRSVWVVSQHCCWACSRRLGNIRAPAARGLRRGHHVEPQNHHMALSQRWDLSTPG